MNKGDKYNSLAEDISSFLDNHHGYDMNNVLFIGIITDLDENMTVISSHPEHELTKAVKGTCYRPGILTKIHARIDNFRRKLNA